VQVLLSTSGLVAIGLLWLLQLVLFSSIALALPPKHTHSSLPASPPSDPNLTPLNSNQLEFSAGGSLIVFSDLVGRWLVSVPEELNQSDIDRLQFSKRVVVLSRQWCLYPDWRSTTSTLEQIVLVGQDRLNHYYRVLVPSAIRSNLPIPEYTESTPSWHAAVRTLAYRRSLLGQTQLQQETLKSLISSQLNAEEELIDSALFPTGYRG
jgi:hypothetical protein